MMRRADAPLHKRGRITGRIAPSAHLDTENNHGIPRHSSLRR